MYETWYEVKSLLYTKNKLLARQMFVYFYIYVVVSISQQGSFLFTHLILDAMFMTVVEILPGKVIEMHVMFVLTDLY